MRVGATREVYEIEMEVEKGVRKEKRREDDDRNGIGRCRRTSFGEGAAVMAAATAMVAAPAARGDKGGKRGRSVLWY